MGMAVLAGRLHMVMMQAVAVAALTGYYFWQSRRHSASEGARLTPFRAASILAVVATICFASGAIQWLPSFEYSNHSYRWVGETGFLLARKFLTFTPPLTPTFRRASWRSSFRLASMAPTAKVSSRLPILGSSLYFSSRSLS